ncbi:MAG: VCBS repeat-containing protein [Nannocystaceae bacterium]
MLATLVCANCVDRLWLETCEERPPSRDDATRPQEYAGAFVCLGPPQDVGVVLEPYWSWRDNPVHQGYTQVLSTPVVAQLNDDNNDGRIDMLDTPDVVFTAFAGDGYAGPGRVVALSGVDGSILWSHAGAQGAEPFGDSGVAVADLHGDGSPFVLMVSTAGLLALDSEGHHVWSADIPVARAGYGHPSTGDLDGDGVLEVLLGAAAVDAAGKVLWIGNGGTGGPSHGSFPADLDGDGQLEVVAGNTIYDGGGNVIWRTGSLDGWPALADFDVDGRPEVINVVPQGRLEVYDGSGRKMWVAILPDGGGGPPAVADFDGDGAPEVAVASHTRLRVFDGDGSLRWAITIEDESSGVTGVSAHDVDGDGYIDVIHADEKRLLIVDGLTGAVLQSWTDHSSRTAFEYPVVADLNGDGLAEIIVATNGSLGDPERTGIRTATLIAGPLAPISRLWSQHAHVDVDHARGPWTRFRASARPSPPNRMLPDLIVEPALIDSQCGPHGMFWLPLRNRGEVVMPASWIRLTAGKRGQPLDAARRFLDDAQVPALDPGEVTVVGPWALDIAGVGERVVAIATADPATPTVIECGLANNTRTLRLSPG